MERDTTISTRPASPVPLLVVGWLVLLLIPGLGFFIGWYSFNLADARASTDVTRTSVKVARFLSYFLVLMLLTWFVIEFFSRQGAG